MKPHCPWCLRCPLSVHQMVSGGSWGCGEDPKIMTMFGALRRTSDGTSSPAVFISHLTASLPTFMLWPFLQQPVAHICNLLAPHLFLISLIFCSCICQVRLLVGGLCSRPSQVAHTCLDQTVNNPEATFDYWGRRTFPQTHTHLEFLWLD